MLRDPRQSKTDPKARQTEKPKRFKLVKLEERIAPSAGKNHGGGNPHYNANAGKYVGTPGGGH